MVVAGAPRGRSGGSGSNGGVDEGKVCSVAWQRQHMHHQHHSTKTSIKQAAQGGDVLPVVELKPFTKKVWRREKSLPNFYEKTAAKDDQGAETTRESRQAPTPNIMRYIRELSEQRKTVDTRLSVDSTQRYRAKMHPKADFTFEGLAIAVEHQQDLIPSFITRQERTKTTLGEDLGGSCGGALPPPGGMGGGPCPTQSSMSGGVTDRYLGGAAVGGGVEQQAGLLGREVSNLMANYTRDKPLNQQQVVLTGGKLPVANLGRRPLLYLKPFSAYRPKQQSVWTAMRRENSPVSGLSPRDVLSPSPTGGDGGGAAAVGANVGAGGGAGYMGLASSANGLHHPPPHHRRDLVLSGSSFHTPDRVPLQPLRFNQRSPHLFNNKLGAAQDSLLRLSRTGAPTVLERNLTFDQEVRLERCRRERSFAAISDNNVLSSAHYVSYDSQPTRGEVILMQGREANRPRDANKVVYKRNGLQRPMGSIPVLGQNQIRFMLGRAVDNSPRSNKSELGDSGIMSSPGEPVDEMPAVRPGEEPIPEQSGEGEENGQPEAKMWAPGESFAALDAPDAEKLRRPLSDTAATETVHVRNEMTPLSAENKARMLPRQGSFGNAVTIERGNTSHRQRREGFVVTDGGDNEGLTHAESGAEAIVNINADTSITPNPQEASAFRYAERVDGRRTSEPNDSAPEEDPSTILFDKTEIDSKSPMTTPAEPSPEPAFSVVRSNSNHSDVAKDSARKISQESDDVNDRALNAQDLEVVSVNSSAPSYGNLDSARDPTVVHIAGTIQEEGGEEGNKGTEADIENNQEVPSRVVDKLSTLETIPDSSPGGQSIAPQDEQVVTNDQQANPVVEKSDDSAKESQEATDVTLTNINNMNNNNDNNNNNNNNDNQDTLYNEQSVTSAREANTDICEDNFLDSECNVSKTILKSDDSSAQDLQTSDEASKGNGADNEPPELPSDQNRKDTENEAELVDSDADNTLRPDVDPLTGVEAIVTVTMEPIPNGDNFDGSKTFLTTSNMEQEDWQNNMVKV